MKAKICPECGRHNEESAWHCADCGETLSIKTLVDFDLPRDDKNLMLSFILGTEAKRAAKIIAQRMPEFAS